MPSIAPKLFVKKPVLIEAVQLNPENWDEVRKFVAPVMKLKELHWHCNDGGYGAIEIYIPTFDGPEIARQGCWIIKGEVKDEFYPCDAEIFKKTYEEVK